MAKESDAGLVLKAIVIERQSTEDALKVDARIAGFLAAIGKKLGHSGQMVAAEFNRYCKMCQEKEDADRPDA